MINNVYVHGSADDVVDNTNIDDDDDNDNDGDGLMVMKIVVVIMMMTMMMTMTMTMLEQLFFYCVPVGPEANITYTCLFKSAAIMWLFFCLVNLKQNDKNSTK